jgi:hypothetical protein
MVGVGFLYRDHGVAQYPGDLKQVYPGAGGKGCPCPAKVVNPHLGKFFA